MTTPAEASIREPHPLPSAEESIRALFSDGDGAFFDERMSALHSSDPSTWNGIAFPIEFGLELASVCNLRCVMCPVPTTSRAPLLMDEALYRKLIDDMAPERGYILLPQGFGESFLHPKWASMLGYAREKGIGPIVLLTNGMLLHQKNVDRVLELGIDALVVSIDGVDPGTYASVRVGGNLEKVEANVRAFLSCRGVDRGPKLVLRIIRMKETAAEIEPFFARWQPLLAPGDEIRINEFNDWAGKVEDRSAPDAPHVAVSREPCRMLWRNISVHADGKVSACCHDSEDELVVGDLGSESIQEIWNGEKLARLREIHVQGRFAELPICLACKNWG